MAVETHTAEAIFVPDLAKERGIIQEVIFKDCLLMGPAVLAFVGHNQLLRVSFKEVPEEFLWDFNPKRVRFTGAIGVKDCLFEECSFEEIGILTDSGGQKAVLDAFI